VVRRLPTNRARWPVGKLSQNSGYLRDIFRKEAIKRTTAEPTTGAPKETSYPLDPRSVSISIIILCERMKLRNAKRPHTHIFALTGWSFQAFSYVLSMGRTLVSANC
jgi:hypothetical protein